MTAGNFASSLSPKGTILSWMVSFLSVLLWRHLQISGSIMQSVTWACHVTSIKLVQTLKHCSDRCPPRSGKLFQGYLRMHKKIPKRWTIFWNRSISCYTCGWNRSWRRLLWENWLYILYLFVYMSIMHYKLCHFVIYIVHTLTSVLKTMEVFSISSLSSMFLFLLHGIET